MQLTESDHFLRDEGPFVSWPPSLLEDLLEEVLKFTLLCLIYQIQLFEMENYFDIGYIYRCADNDALPFIFTFLFRFLNLIDDHWREETKEEN